MAETLLLLDAYSQIYRAYYAIPALTTPTGQPAQAVFGFTKMVQKLRALYRPTHLAVVFDLGAPRQRLALLPAYKAQRPPTPPDLESQLPVIRDVVTALGLPIVEQEGEEADDLIATLAARAVADGAQVLIATTDKDFMQLVRPGIQLLRTEGAPVTADQVRTRYGVEPAQMVDLLSLTGDAVDNIPGVPGVGEKTAARLLTQYGSLANLLAQADTISQPKLQSALREHAAQLAINRQLVTLNTNVTLAMGWRELVCRPPDKPRLAALYRDLGFTSLLAELESRPPAQGDLFA